MYSGPVLLVARKMRIDIYKGEIVFAAVVLFVFFAFWMKV